MAYVDRGRVLRAKDPPKAPNVERFMVPRHEHGDLVVYGGSKNDHELIERAASFTAKLHLYGLREASGGRVYPIFARKFEDEWVPPYFQTTKYEFLRLIENYGHVIHGVWYWAQKGPGISLYLKEETEETDERHD